MISSLPMPIFLRLILCTLQPQMSGSPRRLRALDSQVKRVSAVPVLCTFDRLRERQNAARQAVAALRHVHIAKMISMQMPTPREGLDPLAP